MAAEGHHQKDVVQLSGMPQSRVSRFLRGQGKRLTDRYSGLCKYANYDPEQHKNDHAVQRQLSQAVSQAIGNNMSAAQALTTIIQALAPFLQGGAIEGGARKEKRHDGPGT